MKTDAPTIPDSCAPEPPLGEDDVRWELDTLKELGELGMRLARAHVAEAEARAAAPDAAEAPDPSIAFNRIGHAVRLTVMLRARIREGGLRRERGLPARDAGRMPALPDQALDREAAALADRRLTGRLRRSMSHHIATTAIEALDREPADRERLLEALDERLDREDEDDADFAEVEVKAFALAVCKDLGVDPGPDWWDEEWGIDSTSPPPKRSFGGGGPPNGGGGGYTEPTGSGAASAPQPPRSG